MTDREKLVRLIDEVAEGMLIQRCGELVCTVNSDDIADHLLAHGVYVRESQKPCKFEEISLCDYCWIEHKYEIYTTVEIACVLCKTSEYCGIDFVGLGSPITHKKELYNKAWRCWAEKPTEEERKNAKWEE